MLDHFRSVISCDQTCRWGIEWDTCAPELLCCGFRTKLSAFGDDFLHICLLARMTHSGSFSPGAHIVL